MNATHAYLHAAGLAVALLLGTGAAFTAQAQKTYRCGNTYQSFPCAMTDGKGAPVKTTDSGSVQKPAAKDGKGGVAAAHPGAIVPTAGAAVAASAPPTEEEKKLAAAKAAEEAEAKKKASAAAEKKSKWDKINNDLNYNTAQSRSGGSQTTMERLNTERRKLNDDHRQAGCQT